MPMKSINEHVYDLLNYPNPGIKFETACKHPLILIEWSESTSLQLVIKKESVLYNDSEPLIKIWLVNVQPVKKIKVYVNWFDPLA